MTLPPGKALLHEAEEDGKGLLALVPRILRVLYTLERHSKLIDKQTAQIESLRERVGKLEAREAMLLAKIEAEAARQAAELAGRVGRVEGYLEASRRQRGTGP